MKSVCTKLVDGDHNPPKGEACKTEYIMASSTNINDDKLVELEKVRYLSESVFKKENERTYATKGDIFFTSVGSLGRSCIYDGSLNICFQRSVSVITTLVFNEYLKYCFDSGYFQNKVQKEATGTAQRGFYLNQLANALIPIPPLAEQKRIAAKVKQYLPLIKDYANTQNELYELNKGFPDQLKKSILQLAVQGKLVNQDPNDEPASVLLERIREEKEQLIAEGKIKRDKNESVIFRRDNSHYEKRGKMEVCIDEEIPFEIPGSWVWVRLGSVLREIIVPMRDKPPFSGYIPWCRIEDRDGYYLNGTKSNQYVSDETIKQMNLKVNPVGTVLSASSGASIGTIVINTVECCTNQTFNGLVCSSGLYNWYLFWFLNSTIHSLKQLGTGTTLAYISQEKYKRMLFPLPPLNEQHRIVKRISELEQNLLSLKNTGRP